ncbi:hypothetical protein BC567DRAFT_209769 [Phyllosticta citribraziliensis]
MASPGPPEEQQAAAAATEAREEQHASASGMYLHTHLQVIPTYKPPLTFVCLSPQVLLDGYGCRVERRPGNLVVKHGRRVTVAERDALAYAGTLNLPVPRLHELPAPEAEAEAEAEAAAATEKANAGSVGHGVSIWMDYIDGAMLEDVWPAMTAAQKMDVARQLRAILEEMRRQTDRRLYNACHGGPFADEAAFDAFQLDVYETTPCEVHRVVFTHGDLTQLNIIVDKDSYRIRALLDWEYAGWYPEYWEYVKFVDTHPKYKDWRDYARYILPERCLDELVVYQALKRWQSP